MIGRVVANKAVKTVTVLVESRKTHPLYGKSFLRTKKYLVDDQVGVKVGDIVEFLKTRPISKRKHWRITKTLGQDIVAVQTEIMKEVAEEAIEEVLPVEEEKVEAETVKPPKASLAGGGGKEDEELKIQEEKPKKSKRVKKEKEVK